MMLADQGRLDEAIAIYRKGIEAKRKSAVLHSGLGILLLRQGKIDEAVTELQLSVSIQPDSTAFNNLGLALTLKGRIDEALPCYKKAVKLEPGNAEAHYNIANILLSKDELEGQSTNMISSENKSKLL